ncbi:MAG: ABC transporter permease subunit [Phycisphaerales bacterium]|nr:ABC transporter permease subunit [Phycisphaerales bacterium]
MSERPANNPGADAAGGTRNAGGAAAVSGAAARSGAKRIAALLRPVNLWPGAIVQKEMRVQGRRYFTYLTRGVTAILLAFITGMVFIAMMGWSFGSSISSSGAAMRLQELQGLAPAVSVTVFLVQLVGMSLAGPILLGPSLCDEKRAGTLSALLTTPLTPWQIVMGKLLSAFSQLSILALIPLPLVLAVRVFGGVPAEFVFAGLVVSFAMAFLGASLAVFFSTGAKRGLTASTLAMMAALALNGLPSLAAGKLISLGVQMPLSVPFMMSSPATAAILIGDLVGGGPGGMLPARTIWIGNALVTTGLGAVVLMLATARVRALLRREGQGATAAEESGKAKEEGKGGKAGAKKRAESREVGAHPVMWRELRQKMFRRAFWLVFSLLAAACFLVIANWGESNTRGATMGTTVMGSILSLVLATAGSAGSVNGEREARTWDVLLTTGLSARSIVMGKFVGGVKRQFFVPCVVLLQQMHSVLAGDLSPMGVVMHWVILMPSVAFLSATGLGLSMKFRRPTTAAVFNLVLAMGLWGGLPALAGVSMMLFERLRLDGAGEAIMQGVLSINPVFMAGSNMDGFATGGGWGQSGFHFTLGPGGSIGVMAWVLVAGLVTGGGYVLATLGVLGLIARRFNTMAGRAA